MKSSDIACIRMNNQILVNSKFETVHEIVSHLIAVQSQDYGGAKWALAQRMENATDDMIEKEFNEGKILRTHVMRPTWHFVTPEDIRWLLMLTAPRVKKLLAYYNRQLSITDELIAKTQKIIEKELQGNNFKTRDELAQAFAKQTITGNGMVIGHLVFASELDALICSGPRKGKQFTYALLDERAPKTKERSHDEALAELTLRYFESRGPATIKDFSWWSGLSQTEIKQGIEMVKSDLQSEVMDESTYWFSKKLPMPDIDSNKIYLLPNFDEMVSAYKNRDAYFDPYYPPIPDARGNILFNNFIIMNGKIVGGWTRDLKKNTVDVHPLLFKPFNQKEKHELEKAIDRYSTFLNLLC